VKSLPSSSLDKNDTNSELREQLHSEFFVQKSLIFNESSASKVSVVANELSGFLGA
jgi:hypothetical protein